MIEAAITPKTEGPISMRSEAATVIRQVLDLKALQAFVAVVECRSFRAAAQKLNLTQAAISFRIKRLEQELGFLVLYRNGRIRLTEEGRTLLEFARKLLSTSREALMQLDSLRRA